MPEVYENGINGVSSKAEAKFLIPKAKQAEVKLTDYIRESLNHVALSEGFSNYELVADHGSSVGDGYVGILYKVTIKETDSDKKLALVVKFPPQSKAMRDDFGAMGMFKREVFIYSELLPEFVKFLKEKKIKDTEGFFNFPKCYFAEFNEEKDDSVIIMEDLKENGYKMWDKFVPMNLEHSKLLVEALGKFHAISFAMKKQKPELFEKFKGLTDTMSEMIAEDQMSSLMSNSIQKAIEALDEGDERNRKKVSWLKENFIQLMKELTDPKRAEPYAVVTHGDCWTNNFMFQYKRKVVKKIVIFDWQISRYCSPAVDIVYFIFMSTDSALRATHYDELLGIYHRSLKDHLDHLGGDTMTQFPLTAFLRQLKQFGKYGLLMAMLWVPMITTKNDELPDFDYFADKLNTQDPEAMEAVMAAMSKGDENLQPTLRAAVLDAIRLGYL